MSFLSKNGLWTTLFIYNPNMDGIFLLKFFSIYDFISSKGLTKMNGIFWNRSNVLVEGWPCYNYKKKTKLQTTALKFGDI